MLYTVLSVPGIDPERLRAIEDDYQKVQEDDDHIFVLDQAFSTHVLDSDTVMAFSMPGAPQEHIERFKKQLREVWENERDLIVVACPFQAEEV